MRTRHTPINVSTLTIIMVAILAIGGYGMAANLFLQPTGLLNCNSFGSYADIKAACVNNPQLDSNHNGVCCEDRLTSIHSVGL